MKVLETYEKDTYAKFLGIEIVKVEEGFAEVTMTITDQMLNFHGSGNGGATFSLADAAFAYASNSHGKVAVGINMNINYMKAVTSGERIRAIAKEDSLNSRLAIYRIEVLDSKDDLVALAEGMVYRKKDSFI